MFALPGGSWFPISGHGFMHELAADPPSYWLVQASHAGLGEGGWGTHGWIVMGIWTVVLIRIAIGDYRRDTAKPAL